MSQAYPLQEVSRLPLPGDNVAIVTRRLEAGTTLTGGDRQLTLDYTVLEGHRIAVQPIPAGAALLSWELPFGVATRDIAPGNYVCNAGMLEALGGRSIDFALPPAPNFEDRVQPYLLNKAAFQPAEPLPPYSEMRTFQGYRRSGSRGVGTRNMIVLLGTSSRTGGYVRQLEARLKALVDRYENIDGIVAVAHTEGDVTAPNNLELVLRALAGFFVHPNVGAVLAVDFGPETINNQALKAYLTKHNYPLAEVRHHFLSLRDSFEENLSQGEALVKAWLTAVNATPRTDEPLSALKIALQCGGSDAFSGVSGNPLASWVAREVIRYGGAANLAETDELMGAEPYVLQKVSSRQTAERFLMMIERFKAYAERHGSSAEGNPSGGNKFRGLYNIALKSIGAAMKRHPDVPLDYAIEYGEQMLQPGYYFMDSPGNDLESIAGQVAAGCNLIFFVTGNGSITNFPFVPTIKIVTTSKRFELLSKDMDVNAGAYLDGAPMDDLGAQLLDLTTNVASGQRSVGEQAGHAQVQLWRNWPKAEDDAPGAGPGTGMSGYALTGNPLPIKAAETIPQLSFEAFSAPGGAAIEQVGLILPTSLCSGQIARMAAEQFSRAGLGREQGISRFVSLVHTEGCGCSSGSGEEIYVRTLLGYLTHPSVRYAVLLEHGCEKTHNDYMRNELRAMGLNLERFGWASVQMDGGIEQATGKMRTWFEAAIAGGTMPPKATVGLESLKFGLVTSGPLSDTVARQLGRLAQVIVSAGGTVIVPDNTGLISAQPFLAETVGREPATPSLTYARKPAAAGFQVMETPSAHWVETLSGLGATGVDMILAHIGQYPMPGHPLVPVLQITADEGVQVRYGADLDLLLEGDPADRQAQMLRLLADTASGRHTPRLQQQGNVDFQITRGVIGISL